jgi:hypothetical protein
MVALTMAAGMHATASTQQSNWDIISI